MIRNDFRMHRAGVFLFLLVLLLVIVLAAGRLRACPEREPNGSVAPTCAAALIASVIALIRIKIRFCYFGSHVSCSGSRVGCDGRGQMQTARLPLQRKIRDPESFRGC